MSRTDQLTLKGYTAISAISAALFLWLLPAMNAAIARGAPAVQTYVLIVSCPRRPAQHEQVVAVDNGRGGRNCVYVSARGAYGVTR